MSDARKAAEDLKLFANRIRPLLDVADALERIGGLEQAERESESRADKAKTAAADAQKLLDKKNAELEEVKVEITKTQDNIIVMENKAQDKCDEILRIADEKAVNIIKSANEQKKNIENQIIEKRGQVAQLQEAIDAKKEELTKINNEIEAAKEKIASFVKG